MKGKLSHSMSDMEGGVGGAPAPRPHVSRQALTPLRAAPTSPSPADLTGEGPWTPPLRMCYPQRGYLWAVGPTVCSSVVRAGRIQGGWGTGWEVCPIWRQSIRKPMNAVDNKTFALFSCHPLCPLLQQGFHTYIPRIPTSFSQVLLPHTYGRKKGEKSQEVAAHPAPGISENVAEG